MNEDVRLEKRAVERDKHKGASKRPLCTVATPFCRIVPNLLLTRSPRKSTRRLDSVSSVTLQIPVLNCLGIFVLV